MGGGGGVKVDCLLKPTMAKCINYLVENRAANSVLLQNIYIFCLPHSKPCMRDHDALNDTVIKCGAEIPSKLKSINL